MSRDVAELERRIHRLERANRLALTALLAVTGVLLLAAAAEPEQEAVQDVVQARRIQLVDERGGVRIDLRHDHEETGLFIQDAAGDTRLGAAHFAHGGTGYALHGPGGRGAAVLYLKGDGALSLYDARGAVTARFPGDGP
jgi:hypothetical protein